MFSLQVRAWTELRTRILGLSAAAFNAYASSPIGAMPKKDAILLLCERRRGCEAVELQARLETFIIRIRFFC
jgi:hypothetical protein